MEINLLFDICIDLVDNKYPNYQWTKIHIQLCLAANTSVRLYFKSFKITKTLSLQSVNIFLSVNNGSYVFLMFLEDVITLLVINKKPNKMSRN